MIKKLLKAAGLGKVKEMIWRSSLKGRSHEEVFTDIYKNNKWGDAESISGPGSTLKETAHLRTELAALFKKYNIKTIIDLPCGDFNWFKEIEYTFERYTGCDIVEGLIKDNTEKYGSDIYHFQKVDCLSEKIQDADMILARDLLIHFSNEDIRKFLNNLKRSKIKYILTSHFLGIKENSAIVTGQGRLVNLTKAPFFLPEPEFFFLEGSQVFDGKWKDMKALGLWELKTIYNALETPSGAREAA